MHVDSHLSLPAAERGEALIELRPMRRRAYAHGAPFPRAFRDVSDLPRCGRIDLALKKHVVSVRVGCVGLQKRRQF